MESAPAVRAVVLHGEQGVVFYWILTSVRRCRGVQVVVKDVFVPLLVHSRSVQLAIVVR